MAPTAARRTDHRREGAVPLARLSQRNGRSLRAASGSRSAARFTADARFQHAIERGQLLAAEAAARELGQLTLADALEFLLLLAEKEPQPFDVAAAPGTPASSLRPAASASRTHSSCSAPSPASTTSARASIWSRSRAASWRFGTK